ncbi:MAG: ATP-binding protein [Syntrophobacteraceae bacterium]
METTIIPPLPASAKCKKCKSRGEIRLPSHNTIWCSACFLEYCETAVARAMKKFGISQETELMVAVSGGKDSLGLWNILNNLGFRTRGIHVDLGIPDFSQASVDAVTEFAQSRKLTWALYSLKEVFGWSIDEVRCRTRRSICSVCGTIKRQLLNRLTVREGYSTLASGHNLDDEAGRLLGNTLRHRTQYLEKQYPYLPASYPLLPAKAKPLYRLESHEIRAYCNFASIRPHSAKCPLARGATSHIVKEALNFLEDKMSGTKRDFYFTYLKNRKPPVFEGGEIKVCTQCGEPAYMEICSVCSLKAQLISIREKEERGKEE